ncbi:hypothetical protein DPEC_G00306480 [Dallia pectoralis]|uniref:Uncharacterized protein n=1 Tax=Dallia pectoralis TaxID=75939 RepID=A0ACC2FE74_DALPE|nr:hypothetical protein DPEC_G00306480 [Dallia pectoralis]
MMVMSKKPSSLRSCRNPDAAEESALISAQDGTAAFLLLILAVRWIDSFSSGATSRPPFLWHFLIEEAPTSHQPRYPSRCYGSSAPLIILVQYSAGRFLGKVNISCSDDSLVTVLENGGCVLWQELNSDGSQCFFTSWAQRLRSHAFNFSTNGFPVIKAEALVAKRTGSVLTFVKKRGF